jgi:hypothetical protein
MEDALICPQHGLCGVNSCSGCYLFYEGDGCCTKYNIYKGWETGFHIYTAFTLLSHIILFIVVAYQLRYGLLIGNKIRWNARNQALLCMFVAGFSTYF